MKIPLPTKYDFIFAIAIFGLIIIFKMFFNFNNFQKIGNGKEYFKPNLYRINKGIITNKYIDKYNHANKTIEIVLNDTLEYYYILSWEPELFNYIQINDSILKTKFGNEIIIRRDKTDSVFKLDLKGYKK